LGTTGLNPVPQTPKWINPDGSPTQEFYWFILTLFNTTGSNESSQTLNAFVSSQTPAALDPTVQGVERQSAFVQPATNASVSQIATLQRMAAIAAQVSGVLDAVSILQKILAFRQAVQSLVVPISATVLGSNVDGQLIAAALADTEIWIGSAGGLPVAQSLSGDATLADTGVLTLDTVNPDVGSFTNADITVNAKGLVTAASNGSGGTTQTITSTTPTLEIGGVSTGISYSLQTGECVQTGKQVMITIEIMLGGIPAPTGGALTISLAGAPAPAFAGSGAVGALANFLGLTGTPTAFIAPASGSIDLYLTGATGSVAMTDANLTNTSSFYLVLMYQSA
jgi:hypothetical protein